MASVTVQFCVHILKGKRLELSTPNLVHMAVPRDALTLRSIGHTDQGHGVI